MDISITPLMLISALVIGIISAYLAHTREKNPYIWFFVGFLFGIFGIFAIFFTQKKKKKNVLPPKPEPIFSIQGPIDKFWYYLDLAQQQQGPMSRDALTAAWKEGKLTPSTLIWHEEMADWQPLQASLKTEN